MIDYSRNPTEPAGVLVITVWSEAGELRRAVSTSDLTQAALPGADLERQVAISDAAVLSIVQNWLGVMARNARTTAL